MGAGDPASRSAKPGKGAGSRGWTQLGDHRHLWSSGDRPGPEPGSGPTSLPALTGQERRRARARHDHPWTLVRAPGAPLRLPARAAERAGNTEPVVVVPVSSRVPVAVRGAEVPRFVVPGTAAQNALTGGGQAPGTDRTSVPEDRPAQPPGVCMFGVSDPGLHTPLDVRARRVAPAPTVAQTPQAVAETADIIFRQSPPASGQQNETEERRRLARRHNPGLARVKAETTPFEVAGDPSPPFVQPLGLVVKQHEIVHVAHIALRPQDILAEMIEAVQIDIGEELAGQVSDGEAPPTLPRREQVVARVVDRNRLWCMDLRISICGSASVFGSLSCLSSSTHRVATISPEPSTGS